MNREKKMNVLQNGMDWKLLFESVSPFQEETAVWTSKIYKCVKNKKEYCVKTGSAIDVWNEVNLIDQIPYHPNIIKNDYFVADTLCLIMKWCHFGDMVSFVQRNGPLADKNGIATHSHLFSQICSGLDFLHRCGYVHGDLKMENIGVDLCDGKEVAKLIDLGKTCSVKTECKKEMTLTYMSPEMVLFLKGKIDTYDRMDSESFLLGLVFYSMLTNLMVLHPDEDGGMSNHYDMRIKGAKRHLVQRVRDPIVRVILALLNTDPDRHEKEEKRPSPFEVNQILLFHELKEREKKESKREDKEKEKKNVENKKVNSNNQPSSLSTSVPKRGILKCRNKSTLSSKTETCSEKHLSCSMV